MAVKTVFVLCAYVALALGAAIESRTKRQVPQIPSAVAFGGSGSGASDMASFLSSGLQTASDIATGMANNLPGVSAMQGFGDMASTAMNSMSNGIQGIGGRLQNAFNQTYQEEKNSVSDGFNSVKDLLHQNIETNGNLTKTAFDLGTAVPKFVKNFAIGN